MTEIEGPFKRCCIWFQGCNIHCEGCCNPDLQELKPNHIVTMKQLIDIVIEAKKKYDIEGVTLSGGEPSLQQNLKVFNDEIHKLGMGIIMFSGRPKQLLNPELVSSVDLLIDGPYIEEQRDNDRILIGSKNKNLSFITDRYKEYETYFNNETSIEEVTIDDYIFFNGD